LYYRFDGDSVAVVPLERERDISAVYCDDPWVSELALAEGVLDFPFLAQRIKRPLCTYPADVVGLAYSPSYLREDIRRWVVYGPDPCGNVSIKERLANSLRELKTG
jgi:hypothetical protein